jgi:hypothetical protein
VGILGETVPPVLESQVRMQIAADGYDPTIGFLHTYNMERPALVFDLMEPLRPIVDRTVLEFVQQHTFHPADFNIQPDGRGRCGAVIEAVGALPSFIQLWAEHEGALGAHR